MENRYIKNWTEQETRFGLDYVSAQVYAGDYEFEIRYDCDLQDSSVKPVDCGLFLTIFYKDKKLDSKFGKSVGELKEVAEKWVEKEISGYVKKHLNPTDVRSSNSNKIRLEKLDVEGNAVETIELDGRWKITTGENSYFMTNRYVCG